MLMKCTLINLRNIIRNDNVLENVDIIGFLCIGLKLRFYRACNPRQGIFLYHELEMELMREELHLMMELCWRAKLTVNKSYKLVVDVVKGRSRRVDNFLPEMLGDAKEDEF